MRHKKSFNHLGRTSSHRSAMLSNMANSLFLHKRISTTLAKAKALRSVVEPILTRSKSDTTNNRREVFSILQSKTVVTELFRDISIKIGSRPGGYTRILKTGNRIGDNAEMCMIELVDYNENMLSTGKKETGKKRRSRKVKKTDSNIPQASVKTSVIKNEVSETTIIDSSKEESTTSEKTE
ncbi:MAG: 50S ribosomal protein L17 [Candidatus Taylorbacteria bacterium]